MQSLEIYDYVVIITWVGSVNADRSRKNQTRIASCCVAIIVKTDFTLGITTAHPALR